VIAKPNPASTLQIVRRFLLVILLTGMTGTAVELVLLEHDEGAIQLIPLALLALGLASVAWHAIRPAAASGRAVRIVMAAFVIAGFTGIYFHYRANVEFQLETDPALAGAALFWRVLAAKVPPALAPAVMTQLGLVGLAYTYRDKEQ
jgi:hypothetical protein